MNQNDIEWQDVIELDESIPRNMLDEYHRILNKMEKTKSGQEELRRIQKNTNDLYASGYGENKLIITSTNGDKTNGHYDTSKNQILINHDNHYAYFNRDTGTYIRSTLEERVRHELAHASEPNKLDEYDELISLEGQEKDLLAVLDKPSPKLIDFARNKQTQGFESDFQEYTQHSDSISDQVESGKLTEEKAEEKLHEKYQKLIKKYDIDERQYDIASAARAVDIDSAYAEILKIEKKRQDIRDKSETNAVQSVNDNIRSFYSPPTKREGYSAPMSVEIKPEEAHGCLRYDEKGDYVDLNTGKVRRELAPEDVVDRRAFDMEIPKSGVSPEKAPEKHPDNNIKKPVKEDDDLGAALQSAGIDVGILNLGTNPTDVVTNMSQNVQRQQQVRGIC